MMTTINTLNSLELPGGLLPAETTTKPSSDIDRDGFMKLLVAQLQNQDPLEPLTNEEFVQQLTSFSSLDELRGISESMGDLDQLEGISQLLNANLGLQQTNVNALSVGLIGKEAEVVSDQVALGYADDATRIVVDIPASGTQEITLSFTDSNGESIHELTFNPSSPPEGVTIANGRAYVDVSSLGDGLPKGVANLAATATDSLGESSALETSIIGIVNGIDFRGEYTMLSVGNTPTPITNVVAVNNPL